VNAALAIPITRAPSSDELDDVTLARAQRGEEAAFRALIERYQDPVFALLWRFLGRRARPEIVEDVAQETFIGVYQSIARFRVDGTARLSTWILTIATRTAIKAVRKPVPPTTSIDDEEQGLTSPTTTAASASDHRRFIDVLSRSLLDLAEPYRIVFLLRGYHDFSYQEIADALEIDLGTVKSRLSRARTQLQSDLKEFQP
jgi:RNA polymerase sigma-70 factor, ECF subfamily